MRNERIVDMGGKSPSSVKRRRGRRHRPNYDGPMKYRSPVVPNSADYFFNKLEKSPIKYMRRTAERRHYNVQKVKQNLLPLPLPMIWENPPRRTRIPQKSLTEALPSIPNTEEQSPESKAVSKGGVPRTDRPIPARPSNPLRFKTELCRAHEEGGFCRFGAACTFAHGSREQRSIPRHHKYKTEHCRSYHSVGFCQYGTRCHFVHDSEDPQVITPTTKPTSLLGQYEGLGSSTPNLLESVKPKTPTIDVLKVNSLDSNQKGDKEKGILPTPKLTILIPSPVDNSKTFTDLFLPSPVENLETFTDVFLPSPLENSKNYMNLFLPSPVENSKNSMGTLLPIPVENSKTFLDLFLPSPVDNSKTFTDMFLPSPVDNSKTFTDLFLPSLSDANLLLTSTPVESSKAFMDWFPSTENKSALRSDSKLSRIETKGKCESPIDTLSELRVNAKRKSDHDIYSSALSSQVASSASPEEPWSSELSTVPKVRRLLPMERSVPIDQTAFNTHDKISFGDADIFSVTDRLSSAVAESAICETVKLSLGSRWPAFKEFYPRKL